VRTRTRSWPAGFAALGAGALVAAALPPWGWWPLAIAGVACLDALLAGQPAPRRAARGALFGIGWLAPGMGWMWFLTAPGYAVAVAMFSTFVALALLLVPPDRGRRLGLVAALALAEAVRLRWPFGGVPLATIAVSQAAGPLRAAARLGGVIALGMVTTSAAMALAATWRRQRAALAWAMVVVAVVTIGVVAPRGHIVGTRRIGLVQGGGPQGTRAANTDPRLVVDRHLAATQRLRADDHLDLVAWPENVIDVAAFTTSTERADVAAEAARLTAPFAVGVTEDVSDKNFLNAQVIVNGDSSLGTRYDKVRRVPFGEFMPLRPLLRAVGAPVDLVPRDAVAGTRPAILAVTPTTPGRDFTVGVVISWEVFFGDRARDGVRHGAEVLLNPTNGASYTGTVLQSQQIASSRLRALETGRWVAQVSPTGFSAFISPDGAVFDRTAQVESATRVRDVPLRRGSTLYQLTGDWLPVGVMLAMLAGAGLLARRRSEESPRPRPRPRRWLRLRRAGVTAASRAASARTSSHG
jgi:apolipoprotein N-acyltransferase